MSHTKRTCFYATLACILVAVQALPPCARDDEDCCESQMHPDLPSAPAGRVTGRKIDGDDTNDYWRNQGKEFIKSKFAEKLNTNKAKNVILFLGDGMGVTTHSAARNLLGGEEKYFSFEKFPYTGLSKTYAVDRIVPDSANTATAYLCGVKAMEGTIGVSAQVEREDCEAMLDTTTHVYSIAKWAMDAGKSAGVVTTTRITHASPAGVYAHIADRDWEDDTEVGKSCGANSQVNDIAYQLIHGEVGSKLSLMMGGGKRHFVDREIYANGTRSDGQNLIDQYEQLSAKNAYVESLAELNSLNFSSVDRVLGLFADSHLLYHLETDASSRQPTLEEMTRKAIEFLSRNEQGYFIFIEGGRIDLAHHDNMARIALDETVEFSKAVQAARELTNEEDTLIVVTADHSHAFSYSGYPYRGNDIFGRTPATPGDRKPLMTLSYANGPSYEKFYDVDNKVRRDPTTIVTGDIYDVFPATAPLDTETHGGDDVAVFAVGPWAHLFTGAYEQNTIPHIMAYASCLSDGLTVCT
ncbi:membrane-bound alkaline phosphatase-like [Rhagoletis pomonella]|uniref:membrane-bound alkaline phosphatase-like n=1 Tax=Rhagoletis pomonella TaxID=28610 RepID=UPI00177B9917|nr:membrane-bound alkaline phosphatase-like [Rhagoletis pomonella]